MLPGCVLIYTTLINAIYVQTDSRLFFVIEFIPGGDLMFHMQRQQKLPEEHARQAKVDRKGGGKEPSFVC